MMKLMNELIGVNMEIISAYKGGPIEFFTALISTGKITMFRTDDLIGQKIYEDCRIQLWRNSFSDELKYILTISDVTNHSVVIVNVFITNKLQRDQVKLDGASILFRRLTNMPPFIYSDRTFKIDFKGYLNEYDEELKTTISQSPVDQAKEFYNNFWKKF